ncbi:MAG: DNA cytosine methyltransferase [Pseudoflavonifractor sp.]|nr:DNA cytosine methyltransferase [Pseudoflavonifractor sp.]
MSMIIKRHTFKAISLFTGAGGLDIGLEQAGFETISAVEICVPFFNTILQNQARRIPILNSERYYFQEARILNQDIATVSASDLNPAGAEIDCLIGGPPCQAFSSAGKQDSIFDHRGTLIYEYLRLLDEIRPKVFLFENVRGLVTARGQNHEPGEVLINLLNMMKAVGYHCRVALLNSADYGLPQRRVRCFIIGSRIGIAPEFPQATHGKLPRESSLFCKGVRRWITLEDFLKDNVDNDETNWIRPTDSLNKELSQLPEGKGLRSMGRKEATRQSGHWGYRQGTFIADTTKPARTVTGSSSQDWVRLNDGSLRRITMKEAAALQGFPKIGNSAGAKPTNFSR